MKMVHSTTTAEAYSDTSNEANVVFWHEEQLNTTHLVNVNSFDSSESDCEARMSLDTQQAETQYRGLGIEGTTQRSVQGSINWNEQVENVENVTSELLNNFMKKQKSQASQIPHQSGNKGLLDHEIEKVVNICGCNSNNTKANVWQHHSSQTFIECSFPSSHIVRNEGAWNSESMPYVLNRTERKEFSRDALSVDENESTKMTQLEKHTVHVNNELMDADMDFTDVIHINKTSSGSHMTHVNNDMEITTGIFCRGTSSNNDGVQDYGDLDESEIEFTNTVGHIAASESEDTFRKISEIEMLEGYKSASKASDDSQLELTGVVRCNSVTKDIDESQLELTNVAVCKPVLLADNISSNIQINDDPANDSQLEFTNVSGCKVPVKVTNDNDQELTKVCSYGVDTNLYGINLESNTNSGKLNFNKEVECGSTHTLHKNLTEDTNLKSVPEVLDHRPEQYSKLVSCNSLAGAINDVLMEFKNVNYIPASESCNDSHLDFTDVAAYKTAEIASTFFVKETHCHVSEQIKESQLKSTCFNSSDSTLEFTKPVKHKSSVETSNNSPLEFTNIKGQNQPTKDNENSQQNNSDLVQNLHAKDSDDIQVELANIVEQKLQTKDTDSSTPDIANIVMQKLFAKPSNCSQLEFTNNIEQKLPPKDSGNSQLEFTNTVSHKLAAEDTNVRQLEIIDISQKHTDSNQLDFTNLTMQKLFTKGFDDSQLEFTNITRQKLPQKDFDNSQVVFTYSTIQKPLAEDSVGKQLEFTDSVKHNKLAAKHVGVGQVEYNNIAEQKQLTKDTDIGQLEIINIAMQKLPTKASNGSQLEFTNNIERKLSAEVSDDSRLEFTNTVSHKLAAEDTSVSQLDITDIIQKPTTKHTDGNQQEFTNLTTQKLFTKDFNDSQLEFTNITRQKLPTKDLDNNQVVFTISAMKNPPGKDSFCSQLEFTDSVKHNKMAAKHVDVSELEFTNITGQKLLTKDSDICQLEFRNNIRQKLPAEDSDNSRLEFTKTVSHKPAAEDTNVSQLEITDMSQKPATKCSDSSQLEFTNLTMQKLSTDSQLEFTNITSQKLPPKVLDSSQVVFNTSTMQNPLGKDSRGSQLEFTDSVKHNKMAAKHINVSELEFTNIAGQKLYAEDSDGTHRKFINNTKQKLPVKNSVDSKLELSNNTGNKPCVKDFDSQLEFTNIISKKLPAKDDSQLEFSDNIRQNLPKDDSDDSMCSTNNTRQKLLVKDSGGSPLQITNITRHRMLTKDSNGSQLEFIDTTGYIPSIKNSVEVEIEFTTCKPTTNILDINNCSKEAEAIHFEHTLDCLKIPNELKLKTATLKENKVEGNCDKIDSQVLSLSAISRGPALGLCDESCMNRQDSVDSTMNSNEDKVVVINSDVCKQMLSYKKPDISNESITPYKSQMELTEIPPLNPIANINTNLSFSKTAGEVDQFFSRAIDGSLLEFTNVVGTKSVAESCKSKVVIIGTESAKAVEKDKCIESTVIVDIDNGIHCRKNSKSLMELTNLESHPEYAKRKENVSRSIDITDLGSNLSASRKRNVNDLNRDHSSDCELECSNMKYFKSAERADTQPTIGASESTTFESFNERQLERTATTEVTKASPQHIDVMIPHSGIQMDMTNTVTCETIKNSSGRVSLTFGAPSMYLNECRNNDTTEFTNKHSYASQMSGNLEFTACIQDVNDVSKDKLLEEKSQLPSQLKDLETHNSGQAISLGSNVPQTSVTENPHQDDFTHVIGVIDSNISPRKKEVIRNDAFGQTKQKHVKKRKAVNKLLEVTIGSDETFMFKTCTGSFMAADELQMNKQHVSIASDEAFILKSCTDTFIPADELQMSKQQVTIAPDEAFVLKSCTDTFTPADELQMSKQLEHIDRTHSNASFPEIIQLVTDSATYKIEEEAKENQKQNIENESIMFFDESSFNVERKDETCDNLTKTIEEADKSLFISLSTALLETALSSNSESLAAANAKEHLVEEIHPNLEKNKNPLPSNEPEMMTEVEGNFANGQLSKIHVSKQPSSMNETEREMCNVSVDMDLTFATDKDVSSVEQAEVLTFFSNNRGETKEVIDLEASGKDKETVQLANFTLAHMELNCGESFRDKTEEFRPAVAANMDQSCVAVIQKPLSLEEWLRSGKHEWDVKELCDTQWSFLFLYKSLGLVLKLDAANVKDGTMYISDILLESYLAKKSAPETHFVHHILLKKLSLQNLKDKFKVIADVPELMNIISKAAAEMKLFLKDFFLMETCKLMEMKDNRVSFKMSDMHIHSVFRVSVDLHNWENIKPEDVTVEDLMGTINKKEVQNLVNAVTKGPTFLSDYVDIIREYISVLRKK